MKMTQAKLLRHISRTLLHEIDHKPTTAVQCSDKHSGKPRKKGIEMIDLIKRLRLHDDDRLYLEADELMCEAADALQSQAERVKELERESETHAKAYGLAIVERDNLRHELKVAQEGWRCECSTDDACRFARERDALRAELGDLPEAQAEMLAEIKQLRTQLAEIGEAEPVAWFAFADSNGPIPLELFGWDEKACKHAVLTYARAGNWKGTVEGYLMQQGWTLKPLFTRPMPAQDVTELVEAFEHHIEQTRPIERSTIALSKYKGGK